MDVHDLLEAEANRFDPSADAFDRVLTRARTRRHRRRAAIASVVLAAAAVVATFAALRPSPKATVTTSQPPSVRVLSSAEIPLSGATDVAIDPGGDVWVPGMNVVHRLDGRSGQPVATIDVQGSSDYRYVATGAGAVWVTDTGTATLTRIDPESNTVTAAIDLGAPPVSITVGFGMVWVLAPVVPPGGPVPLGSAATLFAVNPDTNSIAARVDTRGSQLAMSDRDVIVSGDNDGDVFAIQPGTHAVRSAKPFGTQSADVWGTGNDMWITTMNHVQRFDPTSLTRTGDALATRTGPVAVTDHALWMLEQPSSDEPSILQQIDPTGPRTAGTPITVGLTAVDVAATKDRVWVANFNAGSITMVTIG